MINKKGSLSDLPYIGVVMLTLGMIVLFGFMFMSNINTELQASGVVTDDAKAASTTLTGYYPGVIDNAFIFLVIGLSVIMFILATLVRVHPIFIPLFIIGLIFVIFISGVMSNIYQEAAEQPDLITYADQLTGISTVLTYLPLFIGVFGTLLMVLTYKMWSVDT